MPLFKNFSYQDSEIFIWKYDETESFDDLILSESDLKKIESYHPKKKAEFLMVRRILKEKLPGAKIIYDENGQPFLENTDLNISISHSFPLAGIAFSKEKIGVDLERVQEKIIRVKDKFIKDEEQTFIPENQTVEYLTVIWSIKESLYKIHHSNHWSLKRHYEVKPFSLNNSEVQCRVYDEHFSDEFTAKFWCFEDMVFTLVQ